jgi:hypothetical protein
MSNKPDTIDMKHTHSGAPFKRFQQISTKKTVRVDRKVHRNIIEHANRFRAMCQLEYFKQSVPHAKHLDYFEYALAGCKDTILYLLDRSHEEDNTKFKSMIGTLYHPEKSLVYFAVRHRKAYDQYIDYCPLFNENLSDEKRICCFPALLGVIDTHKIKPDRPPFPTKRRLEKFLIENTRFLQTAWRVCLDYEYACAIKWIEDLIEIHGHPENAPYSPPDTPDSE